MQVKAMIEIFEYIKAELESKEVLSKYEALLDLLKRTAKNPEENLTAELAEARDSVVKAQNDLEPSDWPYSKTRLLREIDKDSLIGIKGVEALKSLFDANLANPAGLSKEIKKTITGIKKIQNTNTDSFLRLINSGISSESKSLLTLFFEGNTAVNTINDVERYSRIWDKIIRDFSYLTNNEEYVPVIESMYKESMVLEIPGGDKVLESLSYGTSRIIDTYTKILRIRKLQLEVISLGLRQEILDLLEEEVTATVEQTSHDVVVELMAMNNMENVGENDELFINVQKSLRQVLDFIDKGGKIECISTELSSDMAERNRMFLTAFRLVNEINETFNEMKRIIEEKA